MNRRTHPLVAAVALTCTCFTLPAWAEQNPTGEPGKDDPTAGDNQSAPRVQPSQRAAGADPGKADLPAHLAQEPAEPPKDVFLKEPQFAMFGKFKVTFLNFIEFDAFHDTTQSFQDSFGGNTPIQLSNTYAGSNGRTNFTARNTQIGLAIDGPQLWGMTAGGHCRLDFNGQQPGTPQNGTSEYSFQNSATARLFHCYGTLKTPYIDVLGGLTYTLFGNQPFFFPASLTFLGIPGEVFTRTTQLRFSHQFASKHVDVFAGAAMARPPQRDAELPDGVGAVRILFNDWKGARTIGAVGTKVDSAAIGLSGAVRKFKVQELANPPTRANEANGSGFSVDAFIPIIPAENIAKAGNSLSLTASFARGTGISDMYVGITGGAPAQTLPAATGSTTAGPALDIDPGLAYYDTTGRLRTVNWQSTDVGAQYYLPGAGNVWLYGNFTFVKSDNLASILPAPVAGTRSKIFYQQEYVAGGIFWAVIPNFQAGFEYAYLQQTFLDQGTAKNNRLSLSTYYVF